MAKRLEVVRVDGTPRLFRCKSQDSQRGALE